MKWKIRALCLVLICCSLASGNLSPVNPILSDDCTALCVQQCLHTSDGISLSLAFETPKIETVDESNSLQLASFPGSGMRLYPGEPATPMIGRLFRLPPSGGVMVEVLDAEYQTYTDVDYAACVDELDELEFGACSSVEDAWFPGPLVEVGDPAIFHDFRVANLLTNPVQVNPARQEVRVYSHMNLAVRYNSHDDRNTLAHHPAKLSSTFLPWYRDFLDWDDDELDEYEFYQGNVVVVMRDDDVLWESLADWIAWKRQKGWKLDFLTDSDVDNWTSDGIISELIQRYEAAEEKFDFVVIIGDDTGSFTVPASSGYGSGSGDLFYTMLAGNDYLVDVAIGRMTVETFQHVVIASHKIITYECDMYLEEPVWYTRAMLSRSDTHEGITKVMTLRYWRSWLNEIGYTQVDTSWGLGNTAALAAINDGVSVYSHRGYIGSGIQANQVSALSNDYMLPVVIDLTCYTGNWSGDTGINETWFRTGAINSPRAGIGAIGMATAANRPSMLNPISGGAAYSLLVQRNPEMGLVWMGGEINLWQNQRLNNPAVSQDEQQWCNLMGDPTTWLWTAAPESLFVSTPDLINLGTRQVNVQVTDSENNPVPNAWVTFYKVDENEDVVYSTLADADGFAYLQTECDYPGESIITVSAQNYLPSQTPVTVSLANDNVSFDDYEIVDDGNYQTIGNGDGIPQNGETIGLRLKLACNSDITQTGIFVTGSSADPCIEAVTGTVAIQSMEAGESEWADEVILVELADMIEDHWIVHVDLECTADQSFHTTTCSFPIRAPQYGIVTTTMSDIEPGGNGTLFIMIQNTGGHEASTISGVISAYGNMFHSSQAYRPFGTLSPGETNSTSFSITAAQDALPGALVPCLLT